MEYNRTICSYLLFQFVEQDVPYTLGMLYLNSLNPRLCPLNFNQTRLDKPKSLPEMLADKLSSTNLSFDELIIRTTRGPPIWNYDLKFLMGLKRSVPISHLPGKKNSLAIKWFFK